MSRRMTSEDTRSVISSQASADGRLPAVLPSGQTMLPFGLDPVPASPSVMPAEASGLMIPAISGPTSIGSSAPVGLPALLVSRLQVRLASRGSTLYRLTWTERRTPARRPICALRGSVLRTCDSASTGWPTPLTNDAKSVAYIYSQGNHERPALRMLGAARLCGWATPCARDYRCANTKPRSERGGTSQGEGLPNQAEHLIAPDAPGAILTGSQARTGKRGQLNPAHSRWLMGYPSVWDDCAGMATL
jgi:hypothetical protein